MKAANVAQDQLALTRESAETPLRAYLGVSSVRGSGGMVHFTLSNKGQTPAKSVSLEWQRPELKNVEIPAKIELLKPSNIQIAPGSWQEDHFGDPDLQRAFTLPESPVTTVEVRIQVSHTDWFGRVHGSLLVCALTPTDVADWIYEAD